MNRTAKVRAIIACFGLACCFTGFSARLVYLQVNQFEMYTRLAAQKHVKKQPIYARRGAIQDVNGETLADNEPLKTVIADESLITDPAKVAAAIADLVRMKPAELQKKITTPPGEKPRKYEIIAKEVAEADASEIVKRLEKQKLKGIYFEQDSRRVYPNGEMLCHVLGFMNGDHSGIQGIEMTMNRYLHGEDGFRYTERDRTGKEIVPYRGQEHPERNGYNVRLTVNMGLQNIVETELDAVFKQYRPEMATAIMMDPKTGRILAMANRPSFNPNVLSEGETVGMKNCAIINMVEPGSTFKIVTAAAALNDKLVTLDSIISCENGRFSYAGKVLKDHGHGDHPDLSVADVLVKSSNIGAAKLGMKLGEQRFYEYIRSFGFGERTGISLPGEIAGIVHPPHKWSKISITRLPMGQGVGVTPLQMVSAMCAIANGGKLMLPQIVDSVVDDEGKPMVTYPPVMVREVVTPETTEKVKSALKDVVSKRGTAFAAAVPGFSVAGKTGTAQKPDAHGGYYESRYVTSFIGFMPVEDPQFVCLVMVDDAKASETQNYGGTIAAPVFARIGEQAARYLNLQPDMELNQPSPSIKLTKSDQ